MLRQNFYFTSISISISISFLSYPLNHLHSLYSLPRFHKHHRPALALQAKVMEVITYKKQTSKTKYIIEAALEYRPPLNISHNCFSEKKIKAAASIQENTVCISLKWRTGTRVNRKKHYKVV